MERRGASVACQRGLITGTERQVVKPPIRLDATVGIHHTRLPAREELNPEAIERHRKRFSDGLDERLFAHPAREEEPVPLRDAGVF
jgi:hypothetical protein